MTADRRRRPGPGRGTKARAAQAAGRPSRRRPVDPGRRLGRRRPARRRRRTGAEPARPGRARPRSTGGPGGGARLPAAIAARPRGRARRRRRRRRRLRRAEGRLHGPGRGGHPRHRRPPASSCRRPARAVDDPAHPDRGRGGGVRDRHRRAGGAVVGRPGQRATPSPVASGATPATSCWQARQAFGADPPEYLQAIKFYDKVLQQDPANIEALAYQGWMLRLVVVAGQRHAAQPSCRPRPATRSQQALRTDSEGRHQPGVHGGRARRPGPAGAGAGRPRRGAGRVSSRASSPAPSTSCGPSCSPSCTRRPRPTHPDRPTTALTTQARRRVGGSSARTGRPWRSSISHTEPFWHRCGADGLHPPVDQAGHDGGDEVAVGAQDLAVGAEHHLEGARRGRRPRPGACPARPSGPCARRAARRSGRSVVAGLEATTSPPGGPAARPRPRPGRWPRSLSGRSAVLTLPA